MADGIQWGPGKSRMRKAESTRKLPLAWDHAAAKAGKRIKVFCASLADVFDDDPAQLSKLNEWRSDLFTLIAETTSTDWLLLTKRPKVALRYAETIENLPQIWIGVSAENQKAADTRLPILAQIPASVRFVSAEPLLGPVILSKWLGVIDWVIAGGESGPKARPMKMAWAEAIQLECAVAKVPFFFKQAGGKGIDKGGDLIGGRVCKEFPRPRMPQAVSKSRGGEDIKNCSGPRIRDCRIQLGLSQRELAAKVGLGRDAVAKIESGTRCVTDGELLALSHALSVAPNVLLGFEETSPDSPIDNAATSV
jgi:protein gp37/DNA-binding XRE family transcriptional regulator